MTIIQMLLLTSYLNISICYFITNLLIYKSIIDVEKSVGSINSRRNSRKGADKTKKAEYYYKKQVYLSLLWPMTLFIVLKDVIKIGKK